MNKITIHINDLKEVIRFYDSLQGRLMLKNPSIELIQDSSSGIGYTLEAKLHDVKLVEGSRILDVSTMIVDEGSW